MMSTTTYDRPVHPLPTTDVGPVRTAHPLVGLVVTAVLVIAGVWLGVAAMVMA